MRDGEYLGFTFGSDDFIRFRKDLRAKATGTYSSKNLEDGKFARTKLPLEERWSARNFSLDIIFKSAILDGAKVVEIPWYCNIDNWAGLRDYLSSDLLAVERPSDELFSYHEFNRIAQEA